MSSKILTESGKKKLEEELEYLKTVKRAEIKEALKFARSQGDLSENADYSAAKDDQSMNETRIQEIEDILKSCTVVESSENENVFDLNKKALVKFCDTDETEEVTLVSSVESDIKNMKVSIDSPLGKALYKSELNKRTLVQSPDGSYEVEVLKIL
ncbi:transcription elongation factor GreA [Clostridium acetobutylicum]|uniref:Transcription elongation factor GreA n=1 Tax=Clostridium acetobutylicum (strain ATCC 824 / DSM 792 / JCM 1419 / IAM 19013 / LMG 5710 / NBRC 13948 / NRRL B-527 / VKM B-1787 / 2291 / W) TaxID=272562 RepID=Q97GD8_CLOAB|nr:MULTISPECIES: transcription elongation factor GreA [Clostridium]AAK80384.1 Transcription elongation factor, greA [Clostridium acetobutylicum ATCC 824]ADZ21481.1 Transcription elongation factor, greA [Clostridium acetobutylicum EA 2018]AEI34652.1 transcription elongation factor GreA [Clostridium acetobutylicum DSM 1731]AWV79197.1 transcription elongation factor GreA [Clostridium acetobutylicum]KHD38556.1 transcription elongation factor GreA [Clostridium acetobutylicum]